MSEGTITERLMEAFPPEAIKEREGGGRRRLSYVEGHTVIHRLIKATGNRFDVRVLALEYKGDLLTATVELSIPELGTRQHIGVQKVSERGGEDLVKGAVTDAIKKAATLFGVGLELYGPDYESGEQTTPRAGTTPGREPAPRSTPQRPTERPAATPSAAGPPSAVTPAEEARLMGRLDKVDAHYNGDKGGSAETWKGEVDAMAAFRSYAIEHGVDGGPRFKEVVGRPMSDFPTWDERLGALRAAVGAQSVTA